MFAKNLMVAGLLVCAGSAYAVTGLQVVSTSGDTVGGGLSQTFNARNATYTFSGNPFEVTGQVSDNNGHYWYLDFDGPGDTGLKPGSYGDVGAFSTLSALPGISISSNKGSCYYYYGQSPFGWFRVREYAVNYAGVVSKLAIDFEQTCLPSTSPLYGSLRYNSSFPVSVPETVAIAGSDQSVISNEAVTLDGAQSFSRDYGPVTYAWTQTSGTTVAIDSSTSATPSFVAPTVTSTTTPATLTFKLTVTDSKGNAATDSVNVVVSSASATRTEVDISGDPGDWITNGNSYRFSTSNGTLNFGRDSLGGVNVNGNSSISTNGNQYWNMDFVPASGTSFKVGRYTNVQQYPYEQAGYAGLNIVLFNYCYSVTGDFTVYKAAFDSLGNPKSLDIVFDEYCNGASAGAHGEVLLNAVPHSAVKQALQVSK
jgi:hypothetical protein